MSAPEAFRRAAVTECASSPLHTSTSPGCVHREPSGQVPPRVMTAATDILLQAKGLCAWYGAAQILYDVGVEIRRGEVVAPKAQTRLERQRGQTLGQMIAELPRQCDIGTKKDSQGFKHSWIGYKLHIDTADGDIPVKAILTSASLHDS